MPFFTKGTTAVQLCLLYAVRTAEVEITEDKLFACAYSCEITDWFGFTEALGLILEEGYVVEVPRSFGQSLLLTDSGHKALDLFEDTITASARSKMDAYFSSHRKDMIRAQQFSTQISEHQDGSATLVMNVAESNRELLSIQLALPSQEQALCMRSNWEKAASDIYDCIYSKLLQKDGNAQ